MKGKKAKSQKKFSGEPENLRRAGGGIVRGKESQSVAKKIPDRPEKSRPAGGEIVKGGKSMMTTNTDNAGHDPRDQAVDALSNLLIGISMIARSLATFLQLKKG